MPWHTLEKADLDLLKATESVRVSDRTGKLLSAATINKMLWTLKGVMTACFDLGLIEGETLMRIRRVKGVKKHVGSHEDDKIGRFVSQGERERILAACNDGTILGIRDEAIVALLCACGLRRGEIPLLTLGSIRSDDDGVLAIEIWGKGRKRRTVYLDDGGRDVLLNWLDIRGDAPGAIFWQGRKGGHLVPGKALGQHSVYLILRKRADQAGVKDIATHDLRRSWISDLLGVGIDIATVAALAGHASVTTTAGYDRRGSEAKIAACRALQFACRPRRRPQSESGLRPEVDHAT